MNIGAVITAAGLGSRNGPWTLIFPKALLPIVVKVNGEPHIRPMLDLIITALTRVGCSRICITRRVDDEGIVKYTKALWGTFNIDFTVQPEPRGFGDAVYRGLKCINGVEWVIVHADDGLLINESSILINAIKLINEHDADGVIFVRRVSNPSRYGVLQGFTKVSDGVYRVIDVEEKPREPKSNLALTAVYMFRYSVLYNALRKIEDDNRFIIEFTDAIKLAVNDHAKVLALEVNPRSWISTGTPSDYSAAYNAIQGADVIEIT
jgi:dTDP-glucose pyrophosphorylase